MAASSALTWRTEAAPVPAPATAALVSPVPKPPMRMLINERFMASAMSLVRIPPAAPTRAPAMIRTGLSMTKPAIATAVPVKLLRSDTTTGMSAPPIGMTIVTPKIRAATSSTKRAARLAPMKTRYSAARTATTVMTTLMAWPAGRRTGRLATMPWSWPAAISEPVKVTEPMAMSRITATVSRSPMWVWPPEIAAMNSSMATRQAAPPPMALKMLTSWGIAVIFTVRALHADNWDPTTDPGDRSEWLAAVVEQGYAVPRWPSSKFGLGLSDEQAQLVENEFGAADVPGAGQDRTNLWANTVLRYGTPELTERLLRPLLEDRVPMCLLYSEPGAGSDLAGLRTRAVLDGDEYVVTGQKVWTSGAATAEYGMLVARTDPDVPKHRGISFFFLPMRQPGVEVRPLRQMTGE